MSDREAIIARAGVEAVARHDAAQARNAALLPRRGVLPGNWNGTERAAVMAQLRYDRIDRERVRIDAESSARHRLSVDGAVASLRAAAVAGDEWARTQLRCYEDRSSGNRSPAENAFVLSVARQLEACAVVPPPPPAASRRTSTAAEIYATFRAAESSDEFNELSRQSREQRERQHAETLRTIDDLRAGGTDVPANHPIVNRARTRTRSFDDIAAAVYGRESTASASLLISSGARGGI